MSINYSTKKMTDKISVLVYTRNESNNITDCLASARLLTDSLIVIDMESTDDTAAIAKKQGAQVFSFPYKRYVEPARKFGISKANTGWVFILDADERITAELAAEIIKTINSPTSYNRPASPAGGQPITFFQVPRKNIFGHKKWLKYGGWWPDYQTRLIDKRHFRDWPNQIHSTPVIQGAQGCLTNPLLHYFHGNNEGAGLLNSLERLGSRAWNESGLANPESDVYQSILSDNPATNRHTLAIFCGRKCFYGEPGKKLSVARLPARQVGCRMWGS